MTFEELKTTIQTMIDEHGAEKFLLATKCGLAKEYLIASIGVDEVCFDLGYGAFEIS